MASLQKDVLYLSFSDSTEEAVQSHAALFLLSYTNSRSFDAVLVGSDAATIDNQPTERPNQRDESDVLDGVFQNFQRMSLDTDDHGKEQDSDSPISARMITSKKSRTDIPDVVRGCRFPVILNARGDVCHCGLSTVIRRIVLSSAKERGGNEKLADLLGFRQTSLKNCAEASFWTKLVDSVLSEDLSKLYKDHLQRTLVKQTDVFPDSVTLLEEKLAFPVSTFNIHHQQGGTSGTDVNDKRSGKGRGTRAAVSDYKTDRVVINKKAYKGAIRFYKLALSRGEIPPTTRFRDSEFFISLDSWRDRMKQAEYETIQHPDLEEGRTDLDRLDEVAEVGNKGDAMSVHSVADGIDTVKGRAEDSHGVHSCENHARVASLDVCENNAEIPPPNDSDKIGSEGYVNSSHGNLSPSRDGDKSFDSNTGSAECRMEETIVCSIQGEHNEIAKLENCDNRGSSIIGNPTIKQNVVGELNTNHGIVNIEVSVKSPLKHLFAEGPCMTITDLAVFLPVHLFLQLWRDRPQLHNILPHTVNWYHRMWSLKEVREAALCYGLEKVHLKQVASVSIADIKILPPVDYQHGKGKSRKARNHAIKRELPGVLVKVEGSIGLPTPEDRTFETLDWSALPAAVSPQHGEVPEERLLKKHQQIECLVSVVRALAREGDTIVDFCSGGGHVGIVLAYLLPECTVYMIENNEESLRRACQRVRELKLKNVVLYQSNIGYFQKTFNIGVSLHACGVATDIVIDKCLDSRASLVSSPCCYGAINPSDSIPYPRSERFRSIPITAEEYLVVAHAAEQTNWDFSNNNSKRGKLCMSVIDEDRSSYIREHGYQLHLCSLQPQTCSPKNNLLIGVSPDRSIEFQGMEGLQHDQQETTASVHGR